MQGIFRFIKLEHIFQESVNVPIIANGDIRSRAQALEVAERTGVYGKKLSLSETLPKDHRA